MPFIKRKWVTGCAWYYSSLFEWIRKGARTCICAMGVRVAVMGVVSSERELMDGVIEYRDAASKNVWTWGWWSSKGGCIVPMVSLLILPAVT